jgi:hypothetical protein
MEFMSYENSARVDQCMNNDLVCLISFQKIWDSNGTTNITTIWCCCVCLDHQWKRLTSQSAGHWYFAARFSDMGVVMKERAISSYCLVTKQQCKNVFHCNLAYVGMNCTIFNQSKIMCCTIICSLTHIWVPTSKYSKKGNCDCHRAHLL